jgi:type I restriction-modification system DNA methylase subunit
MIEISTPMAIINEIFGKDYSLSREETKKKYGEQADADAAKVYEAVMAIPWYGSSSYDNNKNSFTADCKSLFPELSEEAVGNLHWSYAAGWIP